MLSPSTSAFTPALALQTETSSKITNAADRKRLKSIVGDLSLPKSMGLIVRTAGLQRTKPEIDAPQGAAPSDLVVRDLIEGDGTEAKPGDTVTVQYKGAVASTGEVFDSSWTDGEPVTFPLDRVIQGWSDGIPGMKAGGRRTLVIPAAMAYGSTAPPGSGIPANADLVFVVDLVSVSG